MLTARIFTVTLDGTEIDRVNFIGPEYNAATVKEYLIRRGSPLNIEVNQVKEIKR